jgi:hypothetical protein
MTCQGTQFVEQIQQMVGNRVGVEGGADDAEQTFEGFAHVDRRSAK